MKAAIIVMARMGLRVRALPTMKINGSSYVATNKGKDITRELPPEVKKAFARAGLSARAPFEGATVWHPSDTFRYLIKRLYGGEEAAGTLRRT